MSPAIAEVARIKASAQFSTIPGRRRFSFRPIRAAPTWRLKPGRNICPAIPICCLASSPPIAQWFPRLSATFDAFSMCPGPEDVFFGAARFAHARPQTARGGAPRARCRAMARRPRRGCGGVASGPAILSRTCFMEAGFFWIFGSFLGPARAVFASSARRHARRPRVVRNGLFLGRIRESRHSVRLPQLSQRDGLESAGACPAFLHRPRRCRRSKGRSRPRVRAVAQNRLTWAKPQPLRRRLARPSCGDLPDPAIVGKLRIKPPASPVRDAIYLFVLAHDLITNVRSIFDNALQWGTPPA